MKFLGRARKFLRELASEPGGKVQYFNVTCASGHRVRGERTEGYQALRCPACGEGVFVLPRSPLPEPAAPARSSPPGRAKRGAAAAVDDGPVELTGPGRVALDAGEDEPGMAGADVVWDDAPAETTRPTGRSQVREQPAGAGPAPAEEGEAFWEEDLTNAAAARSAGTSERRRRPPDPARQAAAGKARPVPKRRPAAATAPPRGKPEKPSAIARITMAASRGKPSRLTLILTLVPLLVMTAVAWRFRRTRMQEYPLIAERGRLEGIPALEEGNFDKAYQLLSAAKAAVDSLGGAVEDADKIRTAADEAALFVDQSPRLLEDMLADAGRTDPAVWASRFETLYRGRAILIDSIIQDEPAPGPASRYAIEYVVLPPGGAANFNEGNDARPDRLGLIDLTGFRLFEVPRRRKGDRVTFGARLASFQFDATNNVWWVGLEPDSGTYITHTKALEAIGLTGGAAADLPLESQP